MFKKWSALLLVVLLIVPLTLTACGGDDDKDNKDEKTDDIKLTQTFTDEATGVTVQYPEGWVASAGFGIMLADSQATLDAEAVPEDGMVVNIMAQPLETLGATDLASAFASFTTGMSSSDVTDIKIGDKDAKRVTVSTDDAESMIIGFLTEDGANAVIAMGSTPKGKLDNVEPYLIKIAETVTVTAPAQ